MDKKYTLDEIANKGFEEIPYFPVRGVHESDEEYAQELREYMEKMNKFERELTK